MSSASLTLMPKGSLLAGFALLAVTGCASSGLFSGPAVSDDRVVSMLSFEPYVNDSYIRRQRTASCENLRTFYDQVERSISAELPDTSSYVLEIVAANRTTLRTVSASRSWKKAGRIQASFRHTSEKSDSVEVRLWQSQGDRRPATWYVAKSSSIGVKLTALGRRALQVSCLRASEEAESAPALDGTSGPLPVAPAGRPAL